MTTLAGRIADQAHGFDSGDLYSILADAAELRATLLEARGQLVALQQRGATNMAEGIADIDVLLHDHVDELIAVTQREVEIVEAVEDIEAEHVLTNPVLKPRVA